MKHPHAELMKLWIEDTSIEIEYLSKGSNKWITIAKPSWYDETVYRIKPNPYQHLIDGRNAGETIQFLIEGDTWANVNPTTGFGAPPEKYRIKPKVDPYQFLYDAYNVGKNIQWYSSYQDRWIDLSRLGVAPIFSQPVEMYRVKPDPIVRHFHLSASGVALEEKYDPSMVQVRAEFDPDTLRILGVILTN